MSSFWESKFLSSERSIHFLQLTHAEVLKGLHEEIESLQQQCANYALKLSMRAATDVEEKEYDQKFKSFNAEYKKKDLLITDQQNLINERNKNIKNLTERIKTLEKKLDLDQSPKDLTIKQLKKELELKSAQIANLTYQLHNTNKSKSHVIDPRDSINNTISISDSVLSPGRKKKSNRITARHDDNKEDLVFENAAALNLHSKASINNLNERRMSTESISMEAELVDNPNISKGAGGNSLKSFTQQRLTSSLSSTHSISSDRSETAHLTDLKNKILPPVVKRSLDPTVPDPKPFLQSTSSTLHTRSKKDLVQRRTLITLPRIKSYEMLQHLAVESPLKSVNHHGPHHIDHNNSSAN